MANPLTAALTDAVVRRLADEATHGHVASLEEHRPLAQRRLWQAERVELVIEGPT